MPVRFVLTGFGPFGSVSQNPSGLLAQRFDNSPERKGNHVNGQWYIDHCEEVEVSCEAVKAYWNRRDQVEKKRIAQNPPQDEVTVYVHLGVGNRFHEIHFETVARNLCTFVAPDALGLLLVDKPVIEGQPEKLRCEFPIFEFCKKFDDIQASEGRTLLSRPSMDAGGYLCNYIFYHSLNYTVNLPGYYSMFLHLPNQNIVDLDQQYTGIRTILQMVADRLCPPPPELSVVPLTASILDTVSEFLEEYRIVSTGAKPRPKTNADGTPVDRTVDPKVRAHLEGIVKVNNENTVLLIAHNAGKGASEVPASTMVGFIEMSMVSSAALLGSAYMVTDLFVLPGARRVGVGRAILRAAAEHSRRIGVTRLMATIEDSEQVRKLMEKEGWRHLSGQCSVILAL